MKKILVAEDDLFLANAYQVKLTKSGYEVRLVDNGKDVLPTLSDFQPDLLILDLLMPMQDGFSVLKEVRSKSEWQKLPIIVASNLSQPEDREKASKLGANDYITKADLSMKEILDKVKDYIG